MAFLIGVLPEATEVPANDNEIITGHIRLFRKVFATKPMECPVAVSRGIDTHAVTLLSTFSKTCSISTPLRNVTLILASSSTVTFSNS